MKVNKEKIKQNCLNHIENKISIINSALNETQTSANSDTKSSAGDKHETSRAMAHIENERLAKQLSNLMSLKAAVNNIDPSISNEKVSLGSFVVTNKGSFFISVGLGKINNEDIVFYAIAINSPVGQLMQNKKIKDSFLFNGEELVIDYII